jgi:hypothetical protein
MERAQPGVNDCARFSLANHKGLGGQGRPSDTSNEVMRPRFPAADLYVGRRCRAGPLLPNRVCHTDG